MNSPIQAVDHTPGLRATKVRGGRRWEPPPMAVRQPGDVVIVAFMDAYPFAWYWPDQPGFVPTRAPTAVRFQVAYPPDGVIVARWSDEASIDQALGQVGAGTRWVWLVVVHATAGQRSRWLRRLAKLGASTRTPVDGLVLAEFPAGRP